MQSIEPAQEREEEGKVHGEWKIFSALMHLSWTCPGGSVCGGGGIVGIGSSSKVSSRWPRPALHCAHDEAEAEAEVEAAAADVDAGVQSLGPVGGQSNYTLMVNNYHNNNNNNNSSEGRKNNDKTYSARCQHYKEIVITIMAQ